MIVDQAAINAGFALVNRKTMIRSRRRQRAVRVRRPGAAGRAALYAESAARKAWLCSRRRYEIMRGMPESFLCGLDDAGGRA
jgi:hypothetical protein